MKCLVFSDSHGSYQNIDCAISRHRDAEVVFFLGDGISDIREIKPRYPNLAFFAVSGNCDFSSYLFDAPIPKTDKIELLGKRIVITHGHIYFAKSSTAALEGLAERERADILLFGHTHKPYLSYIDKEGENADTAAHRYYLFNPGSISGSDRSYGILTLTEGGEPLFSHGRV